MSQIFSHIYWHNYNDESHALDYGNSFIIIKTRKMMVRKFVFKFLCFQKQYLIIKI